MEKNIPEDELKKKSFGRFLKSFKYCYEGIKYAFYHEVNLLVMILVAIIVLLLGIFLKISYVERLIVVSLIGFVLSLEMINCAIEATVDLVTKDKKTLAKIAKDCASGAVGVASIVAAIMGLMIYLPKIVELLGE